MKNTILNLSNRTYLVTFLFSGSDSKILCSGPNALMQAIEKYGERGIDSIKEWDNGKCKFMRASKQHILDCHSFDTESHIYLSNHYFFKK